MGDDRALPRRIFHHLQAREARSPRYRCHSLVQIHPSQVDATGKKKNCFVGAERKMLHLFSTPRVAAVLCLCESISCLTRCFWKEILHFERFKKERIIVVKLKKIFSF